jgi:hypothetical protein
MARRSLFPLQVIQGMTLTDLFRVLARNRFQASPRCFPHLAHLLGIGAFNSVYRLCEKVLNNRDIASARIRHPPIFVLGHWRSGTTHLHNLLGLDERHVTPSAFQALFPHHFLYSQVGGVVFNLITPPVRPMDNVPFSAEVPHEDEFALAAASTISPYLKLWFPNNNGDPLTALDPAQWPEWARDRWKATFLRFCEKVSFSEGEGRLVLKSPPHTGRVRMLLEIFPEARFVHIVRNPYDVYASTHHLWRKSFASSHLQQPAPELVDEIILRWYTELFSLFERDRCLIRDGSLHEMKFEDLESNPMTTLEALYASLDLPGFDRTAKRIEQYLASLGPYRKNRYSLTEEQKQSVRRRWAVVFERYGYHV